MYMYYIYIYIYIYIYMYTHYIYALPQCVRVLNTKSGQYNFYYVER